MEVKARIPGAITAITVKEGDSVSARQSLGTMEAMKMEQPILTPVAGTIKTIAIKAGDKVSTGQMMFIVE